MELSLLFDKISFPKQARDGVLSHIKGVDLQKYEKYIEGLMCATDYAKAYEALKAEIGEDAHERTMLCIELVSAVRAHANYVARGISDEIYFETMKVYTRYAQEYLDTYGTWGFDRGFWVPRHSALTIFRLGTLEYEYTSVRGEQVIYVHIPGDAVLTDEKMDESVAFAREFTGRYYPERAECKMITETWLIAPRLRPLLREDSRILKFMNRFEIVDESSSEGALRFLFNQPRVIPLCEVDVDALPGDTSLRRAVKELYKSGVGLGQAYGILKE